MATRTIAPTTTITFEAEEVEQVAAQRRRVHPLAAYFLRRFGLYLITLWGAFTASWIFFRLIPGDPISAIVGALAQKGQYSNQGQNEALVEHYNKEFGLDGNLLRAVLPLHEPPDHPSRLRSLNRQLSQPGDRHHHARPPLDDRAAGDGDDARLDRRCRRRHLRRLGAKVAARELHHQYCATPARTCRPIFSHSSSLFSSPTAIRSCRRTAPTTRIWKRASTGISSSSIVKYGTLPVLATAIVGASFWLITTRALVVNVLGEDYLTYADAKGLSPWRILNRYVMRNAWLPQIAALGIAMGGVINGNVLVERLFRYPGVGNLLIDADQRQGRQHRPGHHRPPHLPRPHPQSDHRLLPTAARSAGETRTLAVSKRRRQQSLNRAQRQDRHSKHLLLTADG